MRLHTIPYRCAIPVKWYRRPDSNRHGLRHRPSRRRVYQFHHFGMFNYNTHQYLNQWLQEISRAFSRLWISFSLLLVGTGIVVSEHYSVENSLLRCFLMLSGHNIRERQTALAKKASANIPVNFKQKNFPFLSYPRRQYSKPQKQRQRLHSAPLPYCINTKPIQR